MQFVFKRDEEGRETVWVHDVCVAGVNGKQPLLAYAVEGVTYARIGDAIERAVEAGFWHYGDHGGGYNHDEVTVDVPVAETSTTLTLVREDD